MNDEQYNLYMEGIYNTVLLKDIEERLNRKNGKNNRCFFIMVIMKSKAGLNGFILSIKEWVKKTNGIVIISKVGRYGGAYAYKELTPQQISFIYAK